MVNFDPESVERLSVSQKRRILLEGREIFVVFAAIIFLLGVMIIAGGEGKWGMWFVILAVILVFISASRILFMRPAKQHEFITNRLLEKAIRRHERQTGEIISAAERDRLRFKYDPAFHAAIEKKASKNVNRDYQTRLEQLAAELQILEAERETELVRLERVRWQQACTKDLLYSLRDGKLQINQSVICDFSDLDHMQLIVTVGTRDKKRLSRVGVGAHLRRTQNKIRDKVDREVGKRLQDPRVEEILPETASETSPVNLPPIIATHKITTCEYLAVRIYFKNHTTTEIILLPVAIDWQKKRCQQLYRVAWQLLRELELLAQTPMPEKVIKSQDEPKIRELDRRIAKAKRKLEKAQDTTPSFEIPERYLSLDENPKTWSTEDADLLTIDDTHETATELKTESVTTGVAAEKPTENSLDRDSLKTLWQIPQIGKTEEWDENAKTSDNSDCLKSQKDVK